MTRQDIVRPDTVLRDARSRFRAQLWAPVLIPGATATVVAVLLTKLELWRYVGIDVLSAAAFEDLRQVTTTADCARTLVGWNISFGSCDPWQRPYNYPEVWARALAILHLGEAEASYIGYTLIALFAVTLTALTVIACGGRRSRLTIGGMTVAAVSPPSLFAMERGNIDIVVFALVAAGAVLAARRWSGAAGLVWSAAAVLKLFPMGTIVAVTAQGRRRGEGLLVFVLASFVGLFLLIPQLPYILSGTPQTTIQSFGAAVVPLAVANLVGAAPSTNVIRLVGLILTAAVCIALRIVLVLARSTGRLKTAYRRIVDALTADHTARIVFLSGAGCILVAYVVGSSWDYRLIFLIPVVAALRRVVPQTGTAGSIALGIAVFHLLATYPLGRTVEPWVNLVWLVTLPLAANLVLDVNLASFRRPTRLPIRQPAAAHRIEGEPLENGLTRQAAGR